MPNNNIEHIRHSLAHLLVAAVRALYPGAKNAIGPAIENGFYQDFEMPKPITDADLPKIEEKMRELLPLWTKWTSKTVTLPEVKKEFAWNEYKLELATEFANQGKKITFYTCGGLVDLCKGGHSVSLDEIDPRSFKLTHLAGAYWRGDEKNPMLTRIYGLAFDTKEELDAFFAMMEESKKRDHKKLGPALDLFTFSDLVGPGLPLWTPKGTMLRNRLDDFVWGLRQKHGYEKVEIPHITKKELYEKSGHWDKFKDELFKIETREGHEFAMKPMNCPHHIQIFARRPWSYRDLPQRYASTTMCYRDEQTGELSGLSRVRSFTQDDAHVFCRQSQIKDEFSKIWDIVHEFYSAFGFELQVRLSLHDPEAPEKYLGTKEQWKESEQILRSIAKEKKADSFEALGEAAFYGPKIDFLGADSLGRQWQVATIQLDMSMPERFDLSCTNEKGAEERIVMIHTAIMGSIERFLSILIEHFAGAFPLWLSPVQVAVLPISDELNEYARQITDELTLTLSLQKRGNSSSFSKEEVGRSSDLRVEIDTRSESIGKKIREAEQQKIPYMLIVGKKEKEAGTVSVRQRGEKDIGQMKLEKFMEKIAKEIKNKDL